MLKMGNNLNNCLPIKPSIDIGNIPCLLSESHTDLTPNVTIFDSAPTSTITSNTSVESFSPMSYREAATVTYDQIYESSSDEDSLSTQSSHSHSHSSSSTSMESTSDWNDTASTISTATTVLPFLNVRSNTLSSIHPFASSNNCMLQLLTSEEDDDDEEKMDRPKKKKTKKYTNSSAHINNYNLHSLFYPFSNLQSLIFSHQHPYIESDYKRIKNDLFFEDEQDEEKINDGNDTIMDWTNAASINRIRELTKKLLCSSSASRGISEDEMYKMFSSPSPTEIINHLRFGALSTLCTVSIDRFGRRKYHFNKDKLDRRRTRVHFYRDSKDVQGGSSVFGDNDDFIVGLNDFIDEEVMSQIDSCSEDEVEIVAMDTNMQRPSTAKVMGSYVPHRQKVQFNYLPPNATPKKKITALEIREQFAINKKKSERRKKRRRKKREKKIVKFDPNSAHNIAKWGGRFGAPAVRRMDFVTLTQDIYNNEYDQQYRAKNSLSLSDSSSSYPIIRKTPKHRQIDLQRTNTMDSGFNTLTKETSSRTVHIRGKSKSQTPRSTSNRSKSHRRLSKDYRVPVIRNETYDHNNSFLCSPQHRKFSKSSCDEREIKINRCSNKSHSNESSHSFLKVNLLPATYSLSSIVSTDEEQAVEVQYIDLKDVSTQNYKNLTLKNRDNAIKQYVDCADKYKGTQNMIDLYLQRWRQEEIENIPKVDYCFVGIDDNERGHKDEDDEKKQFEYCKQARNRYSEPNKICKSKKKKKHKKSKKKKKRVLMIKPKMINYSYDRRFSFDAVANPEYNKGSEFVGMNELDLNDSAESERVSNESDSSYYPQDFETLSYSMSASSAGIKAVDCIPRPRASVIEKTITWKDFVHEFDHLEVEIPKPKPYKLSSSKCEIQRQNSSSSRKRAHSVCYL